MRFTNNLDFKHGILNAIYHLYASLIITTKSEQIRLIIKLSFVYQIVCQLPKQNCRLS